MARRGLLARLCGERGLTLVELIVGSGLTSLVVLVAGGLIVASQGSVADQIDRSRSNDEVRLAVEQMDREVRSGNLLYEPSATQVRIYTQSNAPSQGGSRCVQWKIESRELLRREWPPTFGSTPDPDTVSDWRVVAESVVNEDLGVDAFSLLNSRTLEVTILVNEDLGDENATVRVETALTGRNTTFNFEEDACDPPPE